MMVVFSNRTEYPTVKFDLLVSERSSKSKWKFVWYLVREGLEILGQTECKQSLCTHCTEETNLDHSQKRRMRYVALHFRELLRKLHKPRQPQHAQNVGHLHDLRQLQTNTTFILPNIEPGFWQTIEQQTLWSLHHSIVTRLATGSNRMQNSNCG